MKVQITHMLHIQCLLKDIQSQDPELLFAAGDFLFLFTIHRVENNCFAQSTLLYLPSISFGIFLAKPITVISGWWSCCENSRSSHFDDEYS